MSRAATGCAGCGDPGHNVRGCLTEFAARYFECAGDLARAARIRRLIGDLDSARAAPSQAAAIRRRIP